MTEKEWVTLVMELSRPLLVKAEPQIRLAQGQRLPYAEEIVRYRGPEAGAHISMAYETDLLVTEQLGGSEWIPRLIIEAKVRSITTHDAITYSQKAATHKTVHPYLRYGIILGKRDRYPLPGRLFRHGAHFDFMLSWVDFEPTQTELDNFVSVVLDEVQASRKLEEMIFGSRSPDRERYTVLHRPLRLK